MSLTLFVADPASVRVIQASPPSWMCHAALLEKGVAHQVVPLDFSKGEHRTPEMVARNPRGTIPVLDHDGVVVHETLAILQYVDAVLPGPPLMPREAGALARALTRLHEAATLKDAGMAVFRAWMRREEAPLPRLLAELDRWEQTLADRPWVAGDLLTLGDLVVGTYLAVCVAHGVPLVGPHLTRYHTAMRARPSIRDSWPASLPQ